MNNKIRILEVKLQSSVQSINAMVKYRSSSQYNNHNTHYEMRKSLEERRKSEDFSNLQQKHQQILRDYGYCMNKISQIDK